MLCACSFQFVWVSWTLSTGTVPTDDFSTRTLTTRASSGTCWSYEVLPASSRGRPSSSTSSWRTSPETSLLSATSCFRSGTTSTAGMTRWRHEMALQWSHMSAMVSQITRMFVQQLVKANVLQRKHQPRHYWSAATGTQRWPDGSPTKGQ